MISRLTYVLAALVMAMGIRGLLLESGNPAPEYMPFRLITAAGVFVGLFGYLLSVLEAIRVALQDQ